MKQEILVQKLHSQVPLKENIRVNESAEPTLSRIDFGQTSALSGKTGGAEGTAAAELQGSDPRPATLQHAECESVCYELRKHFLPYGIFSFCGP